VGSLKRRDAFQLLRAPGKHTYIHPNTYQRTTPTTRAEMNALYRDTTYRFLGLGCPVALRGGRWKGSRVLNGRQSDIMELICLGRGCQNVDMLTCPRSTKYAHSLLLPHASCRHRGELSRSGTTPEDGAWKGNCAHVRKTITEQPTATCRERGK
jgi:hypothetical protein